MLATKRQIEELNRLSRSIENIRVVHPSLVPQGFVHRTWDIDMTSDKASARIDYHKAIYHACDIILHPWKKVAENEDLPA